MAAMFVVCGGEMLRTNKEKRAAGLFSAGEVSFHVTTSTPVSQTLLVCQNCICLSGQTKNNQQQQTP